MENIQRMYRYAVRRRDDLRPARPQYEIEPGPQAANLFGGVLDWMSARNRLGELASMAGIISISNIENDVGSENRQLVVLLGDNYPDGTHRVTLKVAEHPTYEEGDTFADLTFDLEAVVNACDLSDNEKAAIIDKGVRSNEIVVQTWGSNAEWYRKVCVALRLKDTGRRVRILVGTSYLIGYIYQVPEVSGHELEDAEMTAGGQI